ncbi:hypothetical protein B9G98_03349 [Wickerhamiella sorbophila]|uniref:C2 domain-containing protein n=1 Tax=Wickerhamiella sorbophila TaxID=45607 RepID=A0A2T0FL68_9ASCO|nr:hypothetical protein B9G98_03349 [Wickerhamiella sorbophila]PRT55729.1 hypothetical protein B9G98_03349 [Wickerhamiella sorbophila]
MARTFWGFGAAKAPEFKKDAVIPPSQPATTVLSTASANANSPFPDAPAQPAPAAGDVEMDDAAGAQPPAAGQETTQSDISIPIEVQQTKGKLSVRIIEARDLATVNENSNPYVVCTYSNSEHISRSANPNLEVPSGIAIPNSGRHQSSNLMLSKANSGVNKGGANPTWTEEAKFDLTSFESDLEVTIYDANNYDKFLGMCRIKPDFSQSRASDQWYDLQPRMEGERVSDDHYRGKYGTSFRPRMGVGEGIDLYDDKDIKMSESYYTSGIKNKFQADELDKEDELMRMEEEDEEDLRRDEDDFVAGQGFEL